MYRSSAGESDFDEEDVELDEERLGARRERLLRLLELLEYLLERFVEGERDWRLTLTDVDLERRERRSAERYRLLFVLLDGDLEVRRDDLFRRRDFSVLRYGDGDRDLGISENNYFFAKTLLQMLTAHTKTTN